VLPPPLAGAAAGVVAALPAPAAAGATAAAEDSAAHAAFLLPWPELHESAVATPVVATPNAAVNRSAPTMARPSRPDVARARGAPLLCTGEPESRFTLRVSSCRAARTKADITRTGGARTEAGRTLSGPFDRASGRSVGIRRRSAPAARHGFTDGTGDPANSATPAERLAQPRRAAVRNRELARQHKATAQPHLLRLDPIVETGGRACRLCSRWRLTVAWIGTVLVIELGDRDVVVHGIVRVLGIVQDQVRVVWLPIGHVPVLSHLDV
jgi:hypothetical protein